MNSALVEQWKRIRRASVPLVCFESADQIATAREIVRLTNGSGPACMSWDIARGLQPLNDAAVAVCNDLCEGEDPAIVTGNPAECLTKLQRLDKRDARDIVIMYNVHLCFDVPAVLQGIVNLRDMFKQNGHTLVLMGPAISVPSEIAQDIMLVSDVLPDVKQIEEIIASTVTDAGGVVPEDIEKVADTLIGLSVFAAEQTLATCIYKDEAGAIGIDRAALWERKCKVIEQTKGLSVLKGPERFADLMDLDNLIDYLTSLVSGYSCIVFVD